jgi:hypothetical protein
VKGAEGTYVIHGSPTDEELAAVVMAVTASVAAAFTAQEQPQAQGRRWNTRGLVMSDQLVEHGPGTWLIGDMGPAR